MTVADETAGEFGREGSSIVDRLRGAVALALFLAVILAILPVQMIAHALKLEIARRIPGVFHRAVLMALGARVSVRGEPTVHRPTLYVANHVSWTDVMVLGSLGPKSFVAKSEIADWPVFGYMAKLQRSIFVEREKRTTTSKTAKEMAERLAEGDPVVLFAEGTTSDGNRVRRFRAALIGAAEQLVEASGETVWIQPVAIAYTRINGLPSGRAHRPRLAWSGDIDLLPHAWSLLKDGAMDVEVIFGNPIPFDLGHERKAVAAFLESRVRALHSAALRGREADLPLPPPFAR